MATNTCKCTVHSRPYPRNQGVYGYYRHRLEDAALPTLRHLIMTRKTYRHVLPHHRIAALSRKIEKVKNRAYVFHSCMPESEKRELYPLRRHMDPHKGWCDFWGRIEELSKPKLSPTPLEKVE